MDVGADMIGMVQTKTKIFSRRPLSGLQITVWGVLTLCWGASIWCPGEAQKFLLSASITRERLSLLLLHRTHGAQRQVLPIYLSTLTHFLMLSFPLLLVPVSCISSLGLLMRLSHTINQGGLIKYWKFSGLISVVGYGYLLKFIW